MAKFLLWGLRGLLGAVVFFASVGPDDLDSNLSDWLERWGLSWLATELANQRVDQTAIIVCALLLALTILLPWWDRRFPAKVAPIVGGDTFRAVGVVTDRRPLTSVDRERCARAFQELHDFVNEDLKRLYLGLNPSANPANKLAPTWNSPEEALSDQSSVYVELSNLLQRHCHYFDMVGLDLGPTLRSVGDLTGKLGAVVQAKGWPAEAKVDRLNAVGDASGEMWSNAMALMHAMVAKRKEYGI